jgi:hypothetical protein
MTSQYLTTFFTTLAQVSFTLSGFLAIAIAGDNKRRDYWFGNESRSLFIYVSFLLLLFPGFVSLGGLIPPYSKTSIPSWPYASLFLGLIYSLLTISFSIRRKKLKDLKEFERLENKYFKVIPEMGFYGYGLMIFGVLEYVAYHTSSAIVYSKEDTWLGMILFLSLMTSAVNAVLFLRANEMPKEEPKVDLSKYQPEQLIGLNQKANSGLNVVSVLLISAISFFVGLFLKQRIK